MTDAGEAYGAFATADADAIVHLGMLSTPDHDPGHVVFESNAMSTYNVLQAAEALIRHCCAGVEFQRYRRRVRTGPDNSRLPSD